MINRGMGLGPKLGASPQVSLWFQCSRVWGGRLHVGFLGKIVSPTGGETEGENLCGGQSGSPGDAQWVSAVLPASALPAEPRPPPRSPEKE